LGCWQIELEIRIKTVLPMVARIWVSGDSNDTEEMKIGFRRGGTSAALVAAFLQLGATTGFADDCGNATSQTFLVVCYGQKFCAALAALNATYARLMKAVSPAGQTSLRAAQRAWLVYRDQQCAFNLLGRKGASVYPMVLAICKTDLTKNQNNELKAQLNCEEGDLTCGGQ
jgi:uncharacterized protein YecT (DUF1311 family)